LTIPRQSLVEMARHKSCSPGEKSLHDQQILMRGQSFGK
jgi:hypothetical protein